MIASIMKRNINMKLLLIIAMLESAFCFPAISSTQEQGRVAILDFWHTACVSCILAIPKLDSLQQEFGDQLDITLVTYQAPAIVKDFWDKNPYTKGRKFKMITGDTTLTKRYNVVSYPTIVWLDDKGDHITTTDTEYVTPENIKGLLDGKLFDHYPKMARRIHDPALPLFPQNNDVSVETYHTVWGGHASQLKAYINWEVSEKAEYKKLTAVNQPLVRMLQHAYFHADSISIGNRVILDGVDSSSIYLEKRESFISSWMMQNTYCYERTVPTTITDKELFGLMVMDLKTFGPYDFHVEKREVDCMVIYHSPSSNKVKYKVNGRSHTIGELLGLLVWYHPQIYFESETELINELVIPETTGIFGDLVAIQELLENQGYALKLENRALDVLVIREKTPSYDK